MTLLRDILREEDLTDFISTGRQTPDADVSSTSDIGNTNMSQDGSDAITIDVPTLIRLLEWAKEEAQDDVDLHRVAEQLVSLGQKTITMDDYETIVGSSDSSKINGLDQNPQSGSSDEPVKIFKV